MEDAKTARITLQDSRNAADPSPSARRRATVIFLIFLLMVLSALQSGCDLFLETVPTGKAGAVSVITQNLYVGEIEAAKPDLIDLQEVAV